MPSPCRSVQASCCSLFFYPARYVSERSHSGCGCYFYVLVLSPPLQNGKSAHVPTAVLMLRRKTGTGLNLWRPVASMGGASRSGGWPKGGLWDRKVTLPETLHGTPPLDSFCAMEIIRRHECKLLLPRARRFFVIIRRELLSLTSLCTTASFSYGNLGVFCRNRKCGITVHLLATLDKEITFLIIHVAWQVRQWNSSEHWIDCEGGNVNLFCPRPQPLWNAL